MPLYKKVQCPYCQKKCLDNRGLSGHIRYLHKDRHKQPASYTPPPNPKPTKVSHACATCGKKFKSKIWLDRHMFRVHDADASKLAQGTASAKSHLDLAIEEINAQLNELTSRGESLRDTLDVLLGAQDTIKRGRRGAA